VEQPLLQLVQSIVFGSMNGGGDLGQQ